MIKARYDNYLRWAYLVRCYGLRLEVGSGLGIDVAQVATLSNGHWWTVQISRAVSLK